MNVNQKCLEKIFVHLTKLICVTEFENMKDLEKLVNMSTSISAQLIAIEKSEDYIDDEEYEECEE